MRSPDRILVLKVKEGQNPKSSKGLIDNRLFTGENKLHAVMDQQSALWTLKYEQGAVPGALQCAFTSFRALKAHAETYFKNRNIEIVEVQD